MVCGTVVGVEVVESASACHAANRRSCTVPSVQTVTTVLWPVVRRVTVMSIIRYWFCDEWSVGRGRAGSEVVSKKKIFVFSFFENFGCTTDTRRMSSTILFFLPLRRQKLTDLYSC